MQISVSNTIELDPWKQTDFTVAIVPSFLSLSRLIIHRVWSPLIWKYGYRTTSNFLESNYLVLDFDDGRWKIQDAINYCDKARYAYILGTTKSHGIAKGNMPACDRFRLVIPWRKAISNIETMRYNMKKVINAFPCDPQCVDGARCYLPCKEVLAMSDGQPYLWSEYVEPRPAQRSKYQPIYGDSMPLWLMRKLQNSPAEGERNRHTFDLALSLTAQGYSEHQVMAHVMAAPIDLSVSEKLRAAKSGYRIGLTKRE